MLHHCVCNFVKFGSEEKMLGGNTCNVYVSFASQYINVFQRLVFSVIEGGPVC